jgi:hypothetical protein
MTTLQLINEARSLGVDWQDVPDVIRLVRYDEAAPEFRRRCEDVPLRQILERLR